MPLGGAKDGFLGGWNSGKRAKRTRPLSTNTPQTKTKDECSQGEGKVQGPKSAGMWWAEGYERLSMSCPETIVRTRRPAGVASVVCTERTVDAGELAGGQVTVSLKVEGVDWRLPISIRPHWRARQLLALPLALNSLLYNLRAHVRATQNSTCMRNGEMCLCDIFTLDMYVNDSCGKLVHAQRQRTGQN